VDGYRRLVRDRNIWTGYRNTILYTTVGTAINLALTLPAATPFRAGTLRAHALHRAAGLHHVLPGRNHPPLPGREESRDAQHDVGARDPNAVLVWNLVVTRTFFQTSIPEELYEAAVMDGSSTTRYFGSVVLPLSQSIIAVMILFYGIGHWNSFFDALIFLRSRELYPLQIILRDILISAQMQAAMMDDARPLR